MKSVIKYALAGLVAGSAAVVAPAQAHDSFSIGIGISGPGYYGQDYYGYNYARPCSFYFRHEIPAPRRCYRDYYNFYGPGVYLSSGFVFRDQGSFRHWRDRDDFRHWRGHDWSNSPRGASWQGHNWNGSHDHGGSANGSSWGGSHDRDANSGPDNSGGSNDQHDGEHRDRADRR